MYRDVSTLPDDCFCQLKDNMYYGDGNEPPLYDRFEYPCQIPDEMVFERYAGVAFAPGDFWNNGGDWESAPPLDADAFIW